MNTYHVYNDISGQSLGLYQAETPEAAIQAMLDDAGCRDPAGDDLRARRLDGTPIHTYADGREVLSHETGTCDVCASHGWRSDYPDGLEDVLCADYHRDGGLTCGRCAALLVEAEDELEHWDIVSGRYGVCGTVSSVARFQIMCLECFGVDEGLVDLRPGSDPDGTEVMYDEYDEVALRAIVEHPSIGAYIRGGRIVELGDVDEMDTEPGDGMSMIYLPLGGEVGDAVRIDGDGEGVVIEEEQS